MKRIFFLICSLFFISNLLYSQLLPSDYPFKTYVDEYNNLYVTGQSGGDIFWAEFNDNNPISGGTYSSSAGLDKGMDIAGNPISGKIFIAGYLNNGRYDNDMCILKYNSSDGSLDWIRTMNKSYDDKALGIAIDGSDNIYVCGYVTNSNSTTDFMIAKYDYLGNFQWKRQDSLTGNEAATHILLDGNHVYLIGYKSQNDLTTNNDMMLVSYDLDGNNSEQDVLSLSNTNEIPTSFSFASKSDTPAKSKLVGVGFLNAQINSPIAVSYDKDYITAYWGTNLAGTSNTQDWYSTYGTSNHDEVATGVICDANGNPVVTGYYYNSNTNSTDFGTLKYDKANGSITWGPDHYDYSSGIDQASSIKRNGNTLVISGYSELNPSNNFVIHNISDMITYTQEKWTQTFMPNYLKDNYSTFNHHATESYILGDKSVISFVESWNASTENYAVVKYDSLGNTLYTIDNGADNFSQDLRKNENVKNFDLKQNYPNPFNPTTNIRYEIPFSGYVTLKIYDLLGREMATLVNVAQNAGEYKVNFDGSKLSSGIYLYKLISVSGGSKFEKVQKMILIK